MKTRSAVALLSVVGLLACEPILQPEVSAHNLAQGGGGGRIVELVTGSGQFTLGGKLRTFSFTAHKGADGTVGGRFQVKNRGFPSAGHGSLTCLTIKGNEAWVAGVFEKADPPSVTGLAAGIRVVDRGQGSRSLPDQITQTLFPGFDQPGAAAKYCKDTPETQALHDIEAGNIQIHQ